jgi:hypothetical protein
MSTFKPLSKPTHSLGTGAVREGIWHHPPTGLPLERIVADLSRGIQCGLDVAGLETPALLLLGTVGPHSREAVRLQLESNTRAVGATPRSLLLKNPELVLHMMPHFVGDDIGVGELPWRTELLAHQIEEAEIQIDDLVLRAVERTRG